MEMIVGGAFQGKSTYARECHPGICWKNGADIGREELMTAEGVFDFQEYIKKESKKVMNDYFKNWRGITSNDIYINLFKDDELFEIATANRIPRDLAAYIKRETIKNFENGIIDEDDLAPLLYIHMILEGIEEKEKYKHIVVDEVQDFTEVQTENCVGYRI